MNILHTTHPVFFALLPYEWVSAIVVEVPCCVEASHKHPAMFRRSGIHRGIYLFDFLALVALIVI
jgi:hypothetical protein